MKRFYTQVEISNERGILLDGKPVRTPKRAPLILPGDKLAAAVADEWRAQGEKVDPRSMPCTGLSNAAIDVIAPDPQTFAASLAAYADTDALCYRAVDPPDLIARQNTAWNPMIEWTRRRYDVGFEVVTGIIHQPQPRASVDRLSAEVAARSPFELAGLAPIVTISGSLIAALALFERDISAVHTFDICHLDELWQVEKWGEDYFGTQTREAHRAEFMNAARFLSLLNEAPHKANQARLATAT